MVQQGLAAAHYSKRVWEVLAKTRKIRTKIKVGSLHIQYIIYLLRVGMICINSIRTLILRCADGIAETKEIHRRV